MSNKDYDFAGWVTKNDIVCSDGVTIKHGAFSHLTGEKVPLVWQHSYKQPGDTIGHILLHSHRDGVYGYGYLNKTERGLDAKELLKHGDVNQMSIGARKIQKRGNDVVHGEIYEVSLVLKGANPGAVIEEVLAHSYDSVDDEIFITTGLTQDLLKHSDKGDENPMKTIGQVLDGLTEDQADVIEQGLQNGFDNLSEGDAEVLETLSDEQIQAVSMVLAASDEVDDEELAETYLEEEYDEDEHEEELEDGEPYEDDDYEEEVEEAEYEEVQHSGVDMKYNAFNQNQEEEVMMHSADIDNIVSLAATTGANSLKAVLATNGVDTAEGEILQHGISNIDVLFPAATLQKGIQAYNPNAKNVEMILNKFGAVATPNVRNMFADLTDESARARGYIKGNEKLDQNLISLYYRVTTPQTVIHKTAIDRDDVLDIRENGIDAVSFLKQVQTIKFKEELVRAALFGDGREAIVGGKPNPEKIDEGHIRPITTDDDLFTIKIESDTWDTVVDDVIKTLPGYQGSGSPALIINPFDLAKLRVLKDANGRYLYGASGDGNRVATNSDIAAYFGASEVIEFRDMPQGKFLIGNLGDYVFGQSQNGQIVTFDDFDIDFNQMKYLMEARLSGAIMIPRAFIFVSVKKPELVGEELLKFRADALKQKPNWVDDSAKNPAEPGAKYKSKLSEDEKPASGRSGSSSQPARS